MPSYPVALSIFSCWSSTEREWSFLVVLIIFNSCLICIVWSQFFAVLDEYTIWFATWLGPTEGLFLILQQCPRLSARVFEANVFSCFDPVSRVRNRSSLISTSPLSRHFCNFFVFLSTFHPRTSSLWMPLGIYFLAVNMTAPANIFIYRRNPNQPIVSLEMFCQSVFEKFHLVFGKDLIIGIWEANS